MSRADAFQRDGGWEQASAPGVGARLGADRPVETLLFVLFVPSADRCGEEVDHDRRVREVLATFGGLFRGATAHPRARGVWCDDDRGGELVSEQPPIVTRHANPRDVDDAALAVLRAFLPRPGRETNQGEVGIAIGEEYRGIVEFDEVDTHRGQSDERSKACNQGTESARGRR